eukprot:2612012-Lingulodinium_polyedra.AAC.1
MAPCRALRCVAPRAVSFCVASYVSHQATPRGVARRAARVVSARWLPRRVLLRGSAVRRAAWRRIAPEEFRF